MFFYEVIPLQSTRCPKRRPREATVAEVHLVDEDDFESRSGRNNGRNPQSVGRQQLRLRTTREVPVALRAWRP